MKILLIEDDEALRNAFQTYLERRGHTVFIYKKGEGAAEYSMELCPDVTLTDHNLEPGGITGVEIAYYLVNKGRKVVLMSGDPTVAASAEASGVPFVEKTSVKDVIAAIEGTSHAK